LEKSIDERKRIEKSIRDQIREEEQDARVILQMKDKQISELKAETEANKREFTEKFRHLEDRLDEVRHAKHEL
jgi:hypothetical protein